MLHLSETLVHARYSTDTWVKRQIKIKSSRKLLRIFQFGHVIEDMAHGWIYNAGFDLKSTDKNGEQFGFSIADDWILVALTVLYAVDQMILNILCYGNVNLQMTGASRICSER